MMKYTKILKWSASLLLTGALTVFANEESYLLSNNFEGMYVGSKVEQNGQQKHSPWHPSVAINYQERCLDTGATYSYPEGAPDYVDGTTDRRDPDHRKLFGRGTEGIIWQAKPGERVIEVDLKDEYQVDRIAFRSSLWSSNYALNHIAFYRKDGDQWVQIGSDIEGFESHSPYGDVEYYYYASEPVDKPTRYLRVALRNDEPKLITIAGLEVWGKPVEK